MSDKFEHRPHHHQQPLSIVHDNIQPSNNNKVNQPKQTTVVLPKEFILSKIVRIDFNEMPDYLSNANHLFQMKFSSIVPNSKNLEGLRSIAILMYKIICIEMFSQLWEIYQQLCMGELQIASPLIVKQIDRKFIPNEIVSLINHCLCQLDAKNEEYRRELRSNTCSLSNYTPHIEQCLKEFVQEGLKCLRLEIDCQIALIQYYYTDEILQRQFLTQIRLMHK